MKQTICNWDNNLAIAVFGKDEVKSNIDYIEAKARNGYYAAMFHSCLNGEVVIYGNGLYAYFWCRALNRNTTMADCKMSCKSRDEEHKPSFSVYCDG